MTSLNTSSMSKKPEPSEEKTPSNIASYASNTRHVFLVGHGFQSHSSIESVVDFKMFPSVAVTFYCKDGEMFDSGWEDKVMEKVKRGEIAGKSDISRAKEEWEVSTFKTDTVSRCKNYVITRPGGISLVVPFKNTKTIETDSTGRVTKVEELANFDTVCVKTDNVPYTTLHQLMLYISADIAIKKTGSGLHIHWLACRSEFTDIGDIIAQAKSLPSLRKQ